MRYPEDFVNKIICGNSLEVMKSIPTGSIDLVLTDPPYRISSTVKIRRQRNPMKFGKVYKYQGKDISFEFGEWDIFPTLKDYLKFSKAWFHEAIRVLKKGGHIISFWDKHKLTYIVRWAEKLNVKPRQPLFWLKSNPVPCARKVNFMSGVELAFWGTKETTARKFATFNYQLGQHPDYFMHSIVGHTTYKDGGRSHPCQKPISFGEWVILYLSNKGDIILDPFCGSGAFCVAAKGLNRKYIGIDSKKKYTEITERRLNNAMENLF